MHQTYKYIQNGPDECIIPDIDALRNIEYSWFQLVRPLTSIGACNEFISFASASRIR
jgi:hypothetical protein